MKYLLDFLSTLHDAPSLQDPGFQQLLVDVQSGKQQSKQEAFYENLDKIVNELKSSPEALAFLKPVSKRDAPDYHEVIKHPMDLYTVGRNVKSHRYKSKAEFGRDLDLIWENCLIYNSVESHPLRAAARYMRQKAEHHLEFLQDRTGGLTVPGFGSPTPSFSQRQTPGPSGLQSMTLGDEDADGESEEESRSRRATSVGSVRKPVYRDDRPNLIPSLDTYPALNRTAQPVAGPSSLSWYPIETDEAKADAAYWGGVMRDEAYTSAIPACPTMAEPPAKRQKRRKGASLESAVYETVGSLNEIRRVSNLIGDFRRAEQEGGVLPPIDRFPKRKRMHVPHRDYPSEMNEAEATASIKHCSAGLLAHAGFEGANEAALDLFTRMATEHLSNFGKTFRLLLDGFSRTMTPEEIMLHAMNENAQLQSQDLEAHIRDDIEREGQKMAEMERKAKQAYQEVTTGPAIEDDMLLANDGEMLLSGNFADQLGEDFLGLRDLGIAQEYGMSSLTIPAAVFNSRSKGAGPQSQDKIASLEYEPPVALVPLNPATYTLHVPRLFHSFFAKRLESGQGFNDDPFDPARAQIGSNGHVVSKAHSLMPKIPKKKVEARPKAPKKPGVGKGNWIRPSKEEREARRAAAEQQNSVTVAPP